MSIRANVDPRGLDQRIRFDRKTVTQNETTGDITETWSTLATVWGRVDGVKASERWREPEIAGGQQTISDYTVWIRSDIVDRLSLTEADRAVWKGQIMDIKDIMHQQRRGRLTPMVMQAGLNDG